MKEGHQIRIFSEREIKSLIAMIKNGNSISQIDKRFKVSIHSSTGERFLRKAGYKYEDRKFIKLEENKI